MGEAKRRREALHAVAEVARRAGVRPGHTHHDGCPSYCVDRDGRYRSGLTFDEIERIESEDPDDRSIRQAHGLGYSDDHTGPGVVCRVGCGLTYHDISSGKIRRCEAAERAASDIRRIEGVKVDARTVGLVVVYATTRDP